MGSCISDNSTIATFKVPYNHTQIDKEIYWDAAENLYSTYPGETALSTFDDIDDVKGSNGFGRLTISNLRFIWIGKDSRNLRISIGLGTISHIHFNMIKSALLGRVRTPNIVAHYKGSRYDFTFASKDKECIFLFNQMDAALRRYRATSMFRIILSREEYLIHNSQCHIFYGEYFVSKVENCETSVNSMKQNGTFFLTNRRIVWNSERSARCLALSIPLIQIKAIALKTGVQGSNLVIYTRSKQCGVYVMEFTSIDESASRNIYKTVESLIEDLGQCPFYGPVDGVVQYRNDRFFVVPAIKAQDTEALLHEVSNTNNDSTDEIIDDVEFMNANIASDMREVVETKRKTCILENIKSLDTAKTSIIALRFLLLSLRGNEKKRKTALENDDESTTQDISCIVSSQKPSEAMLFSDTSSFSYLANVNLEENSKTFNVVFSPSHSTTLVRRCVICTSEDSEVAFDPCGHLCSCHMCAEKLNHCPICRTKVDHSLRVYF